MSSFDVEYYRKRAIAERLLASASENGEVTTLHEELAAQYEALVAYPDLRSGLRIKWSAPSTVSRWPLNREQAEHPAEDKQGC